MSTEVMNGRSITALIADLVPELFVFLKKLGMGDQTAARYRTSIESMSAILDTKQLGLQDIESEDFKKEYFKVNGSRKKMQFNTLRKFFMYKGFLEKKAVTFRPNCKMDFEQVKDDFYKYLQRLGRKEGTIRHYKTIVERFAGFCRDRLVLSPDKLTRKLVDDFLNFFLVEGSSRISLNKKISMLYQLKGFFKYLFQQGMILIDLAEYVEVPRMDKKVSRNFFDREEITVLFNAIDTDTILGFMDRTIFELMYGVGIRAGETCSLKPGDINFEKNTLLIREGKGDKDRYLPLGEIALSYLTAYLKNVRPRIVRRIKENSGSIADDVLFLNRNGNGVDIIALNRRLKTYLDAAGIKRKQSCHAFRYSCATHMIENGADIRYVSELLGHSKLDTTGGYVKATTRNIIDAIGYHPREHRPETFVHFKGKTRS